MNVLSRILRVLRPGGDDTLQPDERCRLDEAARKNSALVPRMEKLAEAERNGNGWSREVRHAERVLVRERRRYDRGHLPERRQG